MPEKTQNDWTNFIKNKLPAKLPTRGMWPPVAPVSPDDPSGAYRSLGKLKHYRGGDLEQPGELKKAVEAEEKWSGTDVLMVQFLDHRSK